MSTRKQEIRTRIHSHISGYAAVFFVKNRPAGILVLCLTLLRPAAGLYGLLAVFSAYLFSRLTARRDVFFQYEVNIFNPMLTGLAVGYMFGLSPAGILLAVLLGILTYIVTVSLGTVLYTYFKLPALSIPFVMVSSVFYLAASKYVAVAPAVKGLLSLYTLDGSFPLWLSGYFKSLGAIFFMPHVFPGLVLALCIFAGSRILFFLSLLGYFSGTLFTALLTGSFAIAFADVNQFNSILTAMAVGGIFLIPSLKSYLLAIFASGAATLLLHGIFSFWWFTRVPGFPLAFNLVTLGLVHTLAILDYPGLTRIPRNSPEESADFYLFNRNRPSPFLPSVTLPFSGKWTVWQAFDGQWTHRDKWKHAYDFIITDEQQKSYRGSGLHLKDYYAFGKPVLSPINGTIVKVRNDLPDNPIGKPDSVNNWGNHVIIRDDRGFFVEISHFVHDSIRINEGQRVERGGLLGLCGNSGFSSQPHIHMQVQLTPQLGAHTTPFSLIGFAIANRYLDSALPKEGEIVESLYLDPATEKNLIPAIGQVYKYDVLEKDKVIDRLRLEVGVALDGTRYLDSGKAKLYFGKQDHTFYFYGVEGNDPYLKIILLSLPSFPLAYRQNLQWTHDIPAGMILKGAPKAFMQFLGSISYRFSRIKATLTCTQNNLITGVLKSVFPGPASVVEAHWKNTGGLSYFRAGSLSLVKVPVS